MIYNITHKISTLLLSVILPIASCQVETNVIDLEGEWLVQLDSLGQGFDPAEGKPITLPGSLAEAGYGDKTQGSDFGMLTPTHRYVGTAWYYRDFDVPKGWENKNLVVFLERVLWESTVFVDGKELSVKDALGTPHVHEIGGLDEGKHQLLIKVNNAMIHNIGDKGHAYGDYTQSIWNGITGRMELQALDPTYISKIRTFPLVDQDQLKTELEIKTPDMGEVSIQLKISELGGEHGIIETKINEALVPGKNTVEVKVDLDRKLKKWSEFDPVVYTIEATIKTDDYSDSKETEFGFVKIGHNGTNVLINDQPVFLRGNLDCVHFPLTGYPSAKLEDWERIFKIYKDHGLNHVRFHSWCPPEAAFKAANRLGIYIQAEASIWIDGWMSTDMVARGRPEMDTKGHPSGLGHDAQRDEFVVAEMNRVVDHYGNHPSFIMFCIGNELGNSNFDVMEKWISDLKNKDPRRLYAASTARKITAADDYLVTHHIQGIGNTRGLNGPRTDWDFENVYSKMNIPVIAHEIGQWPVYPSWHEIDKYQGVLKARNFEEFKAIAEKNGIADQHEDLRQASGALNQIMYKYEIESFLRTKSCAGVQLLSMQDYQGQGEALIGWLDAHWENKGITTPEKFRKHFDETVPLLRMEKFVWTEDETFEAGAQLFHYGQHDLMNAEFFCQILSADGEILMEDQWLDDKVVPGSLMDIGNISMPLKDLPKAQKLTVSLQVKDTRFKNEWNIWVFPKYSTTFDEPSDIFISDKWDDITTDALLSGGKVLLVANNLGTEETSVKMNFYPLYWSLTFFPGQGKTGIGMLLQDQHPAFQQFPTSHHSDWQWEPISGDARAFLLNDMPKDYKPIAQTVDDFHRNNKEGSIFELKVGNGKLLVCGFNVNSQSSPVARQLRNSLISYMQSSAFNPDQTMPMEKLSEMFASIVQVDEAKTTDNFSNSILNVKAAHGLKTMNKSLKWERKFDQIINQEKGTDYKVVCDGIWKDENGTAWHGKALQLDIECKDGILGELFVHFRDWDDQDRKGILEFEGRKVKLGKHAGDGKWIKLHVMREDSNDGKLVLKANTKSGPNLMISQVILVER